jgi:hypothetical protein
MRRIKRGKRPKLLERGFEVNQWNEYEKSIDNVVMKVNSRRRIDVYRKYEQDLHVCIFMINDIKEEIYKFGIIDLAEEF